MAENVIRETTQICMEIALYNGVQSFVWESNWDNSSRRKDLSQADPIAERSNLSCFYELVHGRGDPSLNPGKGWQTKIESVRYLFS